MLISGAVGICLCLVFVFSGDALREDAAAKQKTKSETPLRSMINRQVTLLFLFYVLTSSANIGLTAFAPIYLPALIRRHGGNRSVYLVGAAVQQCVGYTVRGLARRQNTTARPGTGGFIFHIRHIAGDCGNRPASGLPGCGRLHVGWLRTRHRQSVTRHDGTGSRAGRRAGQGVFAFVSTGFNVGQGIAPLAYGALLDGELTNELLYLSAAFMVASILLLLFSRNRSL